MAEEGIEIAEEAREGTFLYIHIPYSMRLNLFWDKDKEYTIQSMSSDPLFPKMTFVTGRSYIDFQEFRKLLVSRHEEELVPILPRLPTLLDIFRYRERRLLQGLQDFLQQTLDIPALKSDPCLYLFIQSLKTMAQIREEVEGHDLPDRNRAPQGQAAAIGDNNDDLRNPLRWLEPRGAAAALPDEIPGDRDDDELIFPIDDVN